jgi:hypothetical protein
MKILVFVSVLFIGFVSCKKESAVSFDANFEGEWHSTPIEYEDKLRENYIIIIGDNGVYGEVCDVEPMGTGILCNIYSGPAVVDRKG